MKTKLIIVASVVLLIAVAVIAIGIGSTINGVERQITLANKFVDEGKYEEAILAFEKAIEIEPRLTSAYAGLGIVLARTGNYERAFAEVNRAIDLNLDHSELLHEAIVSFYLLQDDTEGADTYIRALTDQNIRVYLEGKFPDMFNNPVLVENEPEEEVADNWQDAYLVKAMEYLNDPPEPTGYLFCLHDINGDGIPELMIKADMVRYPGNFYTFIDGKVVDVGGFVFDLYLSPHPNSIISSGSGGMGMLFTMVYNLQGDELVTIEELEYNVYSDTLNEHGDFYYLNGNEVSKQQYNSLFNQYVSSDRRIQLTALTEENFSTDLNLNREIPSHDIAKVVGRYVMDDPLGRTAGGETLPMLELKNDGSFAYRTNLYEGMAIITGTYTYATGEVILDFEPYQYRGFIGDDDTSYRFELINSTTLKLLSLSAGLADYGDLFIRED
jgi:tetratricopeptide (TPR) repeat protein